MVVDPWGNRIYYMNWKRNDPERPQGGGKHNPTFDLWSTADDADGQNEAKWMTNW
jgi:hypothetical protein